MRAPTLDSGSQDRRGCRADLMTEAVVVAYIHEISDRHRAAAPRAQQPTESPTSD